MTASSPRFAPGDPVRVLERYPPGHVRTPGTVVDRSGTVERVCGRFQNPEQLAYGDPDALHQVLYRVSFASRSLWTDYAGSERDRVDIEIFEHWLEPATGV